MSEVMKTPMGCAMDCTTHSNCASFVKGYQIGKLSRVLRSAAEHNRRLDEENNDLLEKLENLRHAARLVVSRWEKGDLAEAVRELAALLEDELPEEPDDPIDKARHK